MSDFARFRPLGWQIDGNVVIFHKKVDGQDSTCYIYRREELKGHFLSGCITKFEYMEGENFCAENNFVGYNPERGRPQDVLIHESYNITFTA